MFSDEVWAHGGAHTESWYTGKLDRSDRYDPANVQHKYSKQPSWMFHGVIYQGKKGPACFWEKEWGSMDSIGYDERILSTIQAFVTEFQYQNPGIELIWMQDGASSHRFKLT